MLRVKSNLKKYFSLILIITLLPFSVTKKICAQDYTLAQKLQIATAILHFPTASLASYANNKGSKNASITNLLAHSLSAAHNILTLYNYTDSRHYLAPWLAYDVARSFANLKNLIRTPEQETEEQATGSSGNIGFLLLESSFMTLAALNNSTTELDGLKIQQLQGLASLCKLLNQIDGNKQQALLVLLVAAHTVYCVYDFYMSNNLENRQLQENILLGQQNQNLTQENQRLNQELNEANEVYNQIDAHGLILTLGDKKLINAYNILVSDPTKSFTQGLREAGCDIPADEEEKNK